MKRFFAHVLVAGALLAVLAMACGDDDPVTGTSNGNNVWVSLQARPADLTPTSTYDNALNQTYHNLTWTIANATIPGYAPGKTITLTCRFDPPVVVRYDHPFQNLYVSASSAAGFCHTTYLVPTSLVTGDWPVMAQNVQLSSECATAASSMFLQVTFAPLKAGKELYQISISFTVPDTYDDDEAILPAELNIDLLRLGTSSSGDSVDNPPIWQGPYQP
jgi:hypothetical protein